MARLSYKILPARRKSNGKLGIYISLTHQKEVRYISTEFEVEDESQFEGGKVCYRKDSAIMNKRMLYVLSEYQQKLDSLNVKRFSDCASLKQALTEEESALEVITIRQLFDDRIRRLEKEGRNSYAKMNRYTAQVIIGIIGDLPLDYINAESIRRIHRTMVQQGHSAGNIQMRMTHFKAALNEAIDDKLVKYEDHPFKNFVMPRSEPKEMDITIEEFMRIRDLNTSSQRLTFARDLFLLSFYLGGINLADLISADLRDGVLSYERKKSSAHKQGVKRTSFLIQPEAREIIDRYISPSTGKLSFPNISDNYTTFLRYVNRCLALLKEEAGIKCPFSSYSGRKTFSQFAFMLGVSTEIIEYCIGQTVKKNRPIFNYVRVMQRQADAAIRKVIDYTTTPDKFKLEDII